MNLFPRLTLFVLFTFMMSLAMSASAQDTITSLCLVTDFGGVNDGTDQFAHEGALMVTEDFQLEYEFIETESEADYGNNIQTCIDNGADVVVTVDILSQDATATAAEENPDIYFVGIEQFVQDGPANYVGVQFPEDEAGFLVGALAALVANGNDEEVIAGVYGIDIPVIKRFRNGYEQGALYINPEWTVGKNILGAYADSFIDQPQGISLVNQFVGEGAFILFGAGGPVGSAAIVEAASQGLYVIGVDEDEYLTTFEAGETEGADLLISSALKRIELGVYDMVALLAEGDFDTWDTLGGETYMGDVGLAGPNDSDIDESYYEQVKNILELLNEGCLITNVDYVTGDLLTEEEIADFEPDEDCEN